MKKSRFAALTVILIICALACVSLIACNPPDNDKFTITYETGTATTIPQYTAKVGTKLNPPANPERMGYRFDGWTLDGEPFTFDTMPDKNITLRAAWTKLYSLSFDTGAETLYYAAGEQITFPDDPTKANYKFTGWKNNGTDFTDTVMPAKNVALKAGWVATYTITFNTGVADVKVDSITEPAGTKISTPIVKRSGYHVLYWKYNGERYDINTMPSANITLTPEWIAITNLPSMFIELKDSSGNPVSINNVDRITYVDSTVTLTNTKDEYLLTNVKAGFRGRGNGSWDSPANGKRSYKIKFDKKQSLFGQEANKHWVIIACANFDDITMSRNKLAYNMSRELFSAIEHTTIAEWVDVYINNSYYGMYLLCEHTRVGKGRVNISSEYTTEPEHNGFLIEYDYYGATPNPGKGETSFEDGVHYFRINRDYARYPFTVHSPDPEDYAEEGISKEDYKKQVDYIKGYVERVYKAAMTGDYATFAELADVQSFVDMYILHELFKNVDTGYSSFYLYKKPDGKLYAGPPWDFDATTNIGDRGDRTATGIYVADSVQSGSEFTASYLYINLYKNVNFKRDIVARWKELSPGIKAFIEKNMNDEVYNTYKAAMGKNFAKWKNRSQASAETTWVNDMKTLKKWFTDRIAWLDNEWK